MPNGNKVEEKDAIRQNLRVLNYSAKISIFCRFPK